MTHREPYPAAGGLVRVYPATPADPARGVPAAGVPAPGVPAAGVPAPAGAGLVWAHGGGFVAGDLDMPEADQVARSFAERGVAVVSVDYRLVGEDGSNAYPAGSDDVLAAWEWTLAHADELGVDPARLVIGGASAGANLVAGAILRLLGRTITSIAGDDPLTSAPDAVGGADPGFAVGAAPGAVASPAAPLTGLPAGVFLAYPTLLAVQPAPDAPLRAALDAAPASDRFGPEVVRGMYERYLGGPVEAPPLVAVPGLATPADLGGFPPVLMVNSEVDELRVSGEAFATTLAAAGRPVEVVTEPGTDHGHLNRPEHPAAARTIDRVAAWLDRIMADEAADGTSDTDPHSPDRLTEGIPA